MPNYIAFNFVAMAWFFTTFISWFAILITGRYPRGLFKFSVGCIRWTMRQASYLYLLRDEYPPYSINTTARPGNEVLSAIIGLPLFAAYVAFTILPLLGLGSGTTTHASLEPPTAISRDHPTAHSGSLRITLVGYDAAASAFGAGTVVHSGNHLESFDVRADKDGFWPAFFTPYLFSAETCRGFDHGVKSVAGETSAFDIYWRGGHDTATVYFEIPNNTSVCRLKYMTGRGTIRFVFDAYGGIRTATKPTPASASSQTPKRSPTAPPRAQSGFLAPSDGLIIHVPANVLTSVATMQSLEPNAKFAGLIIVLNEYAPGARATALSATPSTGERLVGFRMFIQGIRPVTRDFSPSSFVITDCSGRHHRSVGNTFDLEEFRRGNVPVLWTYFVMPADADVCDLTYDVPSDIVHFVFS